MIAETDDWQGVRSSGWFDQVSHPYLIEFRLTDS